jgi:hypothetical protein
MGCTCQETGLEEAGNVRWLERPISDPAVRRLDFHKRLEPEQASGACVDELQR